MRAFRTLLLSGIGRRKTIINSNKIATTTSNHKLAAAIAIVCFSSTNSVVTTSAFVATAVSKPKLISFIPPCTRTVITKSIATGTTISSTASHRCFSIRSLRRSLPIFLASSTFGLPERRNFVTSSTPPIRSARKMTTNESSTVLPSSPSIDERVFKRAKRISDEGDDNHPQVSTKVIGTHSGTFQADEAMGCWLLRQLPEYYKSKIVRSRDLSILEPLDIVIDVGGVYDHTIKRYDHHQRDYDASFDDNSSKKRCTKLSASGLIYKHYGKEIIQQYYPNLTPSYLELAYNKIYDSLLEALDAIDTGVEMVPEGVAVLYKDSTGLSARVSRLNPRWNEDVDETTNQVPDPDQRFELAMNACGNDFMSTMISIIESFLPARSYVDHAIQNRHAVCSSGQIICFQSGGLPWQSHLYELEKEYKLMEPDQLIKFVLYTDQGGMWRVQAVTVEGMKFTNRVSLPSKWCGLRDTELQQISQVDGCTFVHASGFIGGNDAYEGALRMAQVAIEEAKANP